MRTPLAHHFPKGADTTPTFDLALTALVRAAIAVSQRHPDREPALIEEELGPAVELVRRLSREGQS